MYHDIIQICLFIGFFCFWKFISSRRVWKVDCVLLATRILFFWHFEGLHLIIQTIVKMYVLLSSHFLVFTFKASLFYNSLEVGNIKFVRSNVRGVLCIS